MKLGGVLSIPIADECNRVLVRPERVGTVSRIWILNADQPNLASRTYPWGETTGLGIKNAKDRDNTDEVKRRSRWKVVEGNRVRISQKAVIFFKHYIRTRRSTTVRLDSFSIFLVIGDNISNINIHSSISLFVFFWFLFCLFFWLHHAAWGTGDGTCALCSGSTGS